MGRGSEHPVEIGGEEEDACVRVRASEIAAAARSGLTGAEPQPPPRKDPSNREFYQF
jgi:hypothetical protein